MDNLADAHGAQVVGIAEAVGSEEDEGFLVVRAQGSVLGQPVCMTSHIVKEM